VELKMILNVLVYVLFLFGLFLLIYGADLLVKGSSAIAKRFGIPRIIIGLTVVAFGTSLPEIFVNIFSALNGNTDIAVGNIIGSNIANILLILGLAAFVFPISVKRESVFFNIPFSLLAVLIFMTLANDVIIRHEINNYLTKKDGIIMLVLFCFFLGYLLMMTIKQNILTTKEKKIKLTDMEINGTHLDNTVKQKYDKKNSELPDKSLLSLILMIICGLTALFLGGRWVVNGAVKIAEMFSLSNFLISSSVIAIGTSLPELVTSIVAAFKKEPDISIGNVVGSNIINILLVLGLTTLIKPISIHPVVNYDIGVLLASSVFLLVIMLLGKRKFTIEKWEGALMVLSYAGYISYIIIRG
jgi:cation:H+ antiporter